MAWVFQIVIARNHFEGFIGRRQCCIDGLRVAGKHAGIARTLNHQAWNGDAIEVWVPRQCESLRLHIDSQVRSVLVKPIPRGP